MTDRAISVANRAARRFDQRHYDEVLRAPTRSSAVI